MSFSRALPSKTNGISTTKSSLPTLPKGPSRLQSKRPHPTTIKTEMKLEFSSSIPNEEDLDDIVNNLSTIVKRSEQILTPVKSSHISTVRRTSSLHISNQQNLSNSFVKTSNSHHEQLTDSNLDLSRFNPARRSIRNLEKFSGIKCSLPSATSTLPNTFKSHEKHCTPTKPKQTNDNQITPVKSPWRLRFEKFLNHQELTPISPTNESIAFKTAKTLSLNKENRTPSFRLPARRTSKIHSLTKQND